MLPVGGIKEKVLAAHRAGINTVILPQRNEKDLEDVPESAREAMRFIFVDTMDEVLDLALRAGPDRRRSPRTPDPVRMPELRKDPVTGRWVIIGTERPRRPDDFRPVLAPRSGRPVRAVRGARARDAARAARVPRARRAAERPGWRVRVVPNKFPTLRVEGELERRGHGVYDLMNGVGAHELVIESPHHEDTLASLPAARARGGACTPTRSACSTSGATTRFRSVVVFKNAAATTALALEHPHTHVLATPTVPPDVADELRPGARATSTTASAASSATSCSRRPTRTAASSLALDHVVGDRAVRRPLPFETWLLPRRHQAGFEHVTALERRDLAPRAQDDRASGSTPPARTRRSPSCSTARPFGGEHAASYHWHLEITPAAAVPGFQPEGSGFPVNPLPPEDAARFLRDDWS